MTGTRISAPSVTLGIAAALAVGCALPATAQIQVDVNGRAVSFGAVGPQRIDGRVLIPLRAVVEALGADVEWDRATQTVQGRKGDREFSLPIGSRTATVNRSTVNLDVPAQLIRGNTMVPLRFVAEALGAEVGWNAATQQVAITNGTGGDLPREPMAESERVRGEVVAVTAGQITVRTGGLRQTYRVNRSTVVTRGREGQRGAVSDLDQVRPGDTVSLLVNADRGTAEKVEVFTAAREDRDPRGPLDRDPRDANSAYGELVAIRTRGGRSTLTVQTRTGREAFELSRGAQVSRAVGRQPGRPADAADLRIGDRVRLVQDADGVVTRVEARSFGGNAPGAGSAPSRSAVTGELAAVRSTANPPTIIVLVGGRRVTFEVTRETDIYRASGAGRNPARANLEDLQPGDTVRVRTDASGAVAQVIDVDNR